MELPRAPPLSPSWAGRPALSQSLGSEQPHGWTKCSHHNLIVIVLPSNVKAISFQDGEGMRLHKQRSEARAHATLNWFHAVWYHIKMHFAIVVFIPVLGKQLMIFVMLIVAVDGTPAGSETQWQMCQPANLAAGTSTSTLNLGLKQHTKDWNQPHPKSVHVLCVRAKISIVFSYF